MNPWFAKAVVLIASIVTVLIRAPHGKRSRTVKVAKSRKGLLEVSLLAVAWMAFFVPIIWIATPWLDLANFPLYPFPLVIGSLLLALSLWLFHRSHADLGTNWSITLEIRESHRLVTEGAYRHVRHPMYAALLLYGLGQVMVVPNWVAGPRCRDGAAVCTSSQARRGFDEGSVQGRVRGVCVPNKEAYSRHLVMLATSACSRRCSLAAPQERA